MTWSTSAGGTQLRLCLPGKNETRDSCDALVLQNYSANGSTVIDVNNPGLLKSVFARFDETERTGPELPAASSATYAEGIHPENRLARLY